MSLLNRKPVLHDFYFPQMYMPYQDFSDHDKFWNGSELIEVNYTFKKAMRVMHLQEQGDTEGIIKELGLSYEDSLSFLKAMNEVRWESPASQNDEILGLSHEEAKEINKKTALFDYQKDFDAYWADFLEYYGIDLTTDDIPFVKFLWLLSSLFGKEGSATANRISARAYKANKDHGSDYVKYMMDKKRTYMLEPEDKSEMFEALKRGGNNGNER